MSTDDKFLSYLRQNSMFDPRFKEQSRRERKVGRKKPKYCELHERMILKPKTSAAPVADHCHESGTYRGWICRTCNTQLLPEIDRLRKEGISAEDIKSFLAICVDYSFTTGKSLEQLYRARALPQLPKKI